MATTYYVDPAAAGANNGTSWTDAWTSIQSAFDTAVATDTVYCRGTQTISAAIDVDTNSGTNAAGWINFIGCNSSGVVDGTRFVIDAATADCYGLAVAGMDMIWLENIEIKNCGGTVRDGINFGTSAASGWVVINCSFHNNSRCGTLDQSGYTTNSVWVRCTFYANGADGARGCTGSARYLFCSFHDNTGDGVNTASSTFIGCEFYDNGDDGVDVYAYCFLYNCVVNHNTDDGVMIAAHTNLYPTVVIGCRITNQSGSLDLGLNCNSEPFVTGWNYFENNGGTPSPANRNIANATVHRAIPIEGGSTSSNIEDQADTNSGYTDLTNNAEDFNLTSTATLRRTSITVPKS